MRYLIILTLAYLITLQVNAQKINKNFDWNSYTEWHNETVYSKTYVVNKNHIEASDDNPGTFEKPLLTINKAAQLVKAGERVLIYSGVYREMIKPLNQGEGRDKMISYESAPGEKVIIKGSRVLNTEWEQRTVYTDAKPDSNKIYTWSRKIWVTEVPDKLFSGDYFPLKLPNIEPWEFELMYWAHLVQKLAPYVSKRGLIFQNGKRMVQLEDYEDLQRVEGSFWVDNDAKTLHIHPFKNRNPNNDLFEIGVQSHLFKPQKIGQGYIQIKGLTFEHCANGFLRTSTGAVTALGGHHWIIKDNTIRQNNSSGLEFGFFAYEFKDPRPENIQPRKEKEQGGMMVSGNKIYECGTAGIRCYSVKNAIIKNNTIWNCGWQDAENYWEVSGMKILRAHNILVKGNHIYNIQGGNGIWLDWDIQYSRVTGNIIHDIQNIQGGIFVEAAHHPNLVDNNFIWNIDGHGIYCNDSDELLIYHNLVANTTGPIVNVIVATQRKLNNRWLTSTNNKIYNNIFINGGKEINFNSDKNFADYNVYVTTKEPEQIDFLAWQQKGYDKNSTVIRAYANFNPACLYFNWQSKIELPKVPKISDSKFDYFYNKRTEKMVVPGPFKKLGKSTKVLLNETVF